MDCFVVFKIIGDTTKSTVKNLTLLSVAGQNQQNFCQLIASISRGLHTVDSVPGSEDIFGGVKFRTFSRTQNPHFKFVLQT